MVFAAVDNDQKDLGLLREGMAVAIPGCQIEAFTDPLLSAKYICNNPVDIVFLADAMRPVNGFRLIQVLRKNIPDVPVVMLLSTASNEADAIRVGANGCIVKPISVEKLRQVEQEVRKLSSKSFEEV